MQAPLRSIRSVAVTAPSKLVKFSFFTVDTPTYFGFGAIECLGLFGLDAAPQTGRPHGLDQLKHLQLDPVKITIFRIFFHAAHLIKFGQQFRLLAQPRY